jgi:hypothetical protein
MNKTIIGELMLSQKDERLYLEDKHVADVYKITDTDKNHDCRICGSRNAYDTFILTQDEEKLILCGEACLLKHVYCGSH